MRTYVTPITDKKSVFGKTGHVDILTTVHTFCISWLKPFPSSLYSCTILKYLPQIPSLLAYRMDTPISKTISTPFQNQSPPSSSALFQLRSEKVGEAEDRLFKAYVDEIKSWWASPRYEGIKRPYSAEDVAVTRGSFQPIYASSAMARKLFNLITQKASEGKSLSTSSDSPIFLLEYS